ncbi:response regulator receiver [Planctopirus limnophila DSM 3776]|uniref:Response regulator receiver n=2 Tax=Planctopirus TaxID=1649480 RepID=D5SSR9_PLAL2|nr:response regulator receiver [Planctopirus limnophila DSM 3776]
MTIPPVMSPTVFVVDDDEDLRDSVVTLLRASGYVVRSFVSGDDFASKYQQTQPGCLLLDIRMPGIGGLELYQQLLLQGRRLPVIFMTAHASVEIAVTAMKSGAIEFLEKPFESQRLLKLVAQALELDAAWRQSESRFERLETAVQELSATDIETLDLILQGESNKGMATRLFISERAIELRRQRLMRKLKVQSLAELLQLTITHRVLAEVRQLQRNEQGRVPTLNRIQ